MTKEHIRKIVDLPAVHLSGPDYVPAPTRDPKFARSVMDEGQER